MGVEGGDGGLGEGPKQRFTVAQRWQAWWRNCDEAAEEEERGCSNGEGAPCIAARGGWQWRRELRPRAMAR
jgi:hypothetical protein